MRPGSAALAANTSRWLRLVAYHSRMKIGFIGLGQMGREMAARLIAAGHELIVYNRSPAPAQAFRGRARIAHGPAETVDAEIVITMLADDAAVDAVWSGI